MTNFPRRLSVIVSADIVGYNRLIGADEEGTSTALKEHREAIDPIFLEDGGRIVKNTGDGLLLEFPSAFNAVHASLGVQRMMAERNKDVPPDKRLEFRVGMHLGDVLVEDEDASGDGINIAERLQEIADPGGICLSRAAHAAVHKDFDSMFPDGGSKALKDIEAPVHVYKLAPEAAMLADVPAMTMPRQLLSLVVLPFVNSTGAARHDFLADSITDQLTSELPRIEDSFVVDRKTALAAAAFDDDLAALGRRLGIRHALRGSVRTGETGLRIDAKLIDTETGANIWTDHLDIAIGDPFVMQHDVNARLVPLVYTRLLAATGHAPQTAPAAVLRMTPVRAAQPLSIAPLVARDAAPIAAVPVAHLRAEAPTPTVAQALWAIPTSPLHVEPRVPPQLFPPLEKTAQAEMAPLEPDKLAALIARWPVLHRPSPRRPVPRLPALTASARPEASDAGSAVGHSTTAGNRGVARSGTDHRAGAGDRGAGRTGGKAADYPSAHGRRTRTHPEAGGGLSRGGARSGYL
jgi:class 3 adenylate cyclase